MSKHSIGIYVWLYSQTAYMQMKNGGDHSSSDRWAERGSILIQTPRGVEEGWPSKSMQVWCLYFHI